MKLLLSGFIIGFNMLGFLSDLFGDGKSEVGELQPREINIIGNVFHFSMPENFSKDMPAEDLIDVVTEQQLKKLESDGYLILMQRWWNLKESGMFGKKYGSVMMSIRLQKKPENRLKINGDAPYKFSDYLEFCLALHDSFRQQADKHNRVRDKQDEEFMLYVPDLAVMFGNRLEASLSSFQPDETIWIAAETMQGKIVNKIFAVPLNDDTYVEVNFSIMPDDDFPPYDFLRIASEKLINVVSNTFVLKYSSQNPYAEITSYGWKQKSIESELQSRNINLFPEGDNSPKVLE